MQVQRECEGRPVAVDLTAAISLPLETLALVLWAHSRIVGGLGRDLDPAGGSMWDLDPAGGSRWDLDPKDPVGLPHKALALVLHELRGRARVGSRSGRPGQRQSPNSPTHLACSAVGKDRS